MHRERYQTVHAKEVALLQQSTAGLHFTKELLAEIQAAGVHPSISLTSDNL